MNFREFKGYSQKVFRLPDMLSEVKDGRIGPHHPLPKVLSALLYGAIFRKHSAHSIEESTRCGSLYSLTGFISEDTMGRCCDTLSLWDLWGVLVGIGRIAKRCGMLKAPFLGGKIIAVVDGIEILKSYKRGCSACLVRRVKVKRGGKEIEVDQFYHRCVIMCLATEDFPIPLGVWPIRPGEDEVGPALALIKQSIKRFGPRFFDILIADGLYGRTSFVNAIRELNKGIIFVLKENQPELMREARQSVRGRAPDKILHPSKNETVSIWDSKEVWWDVADRSVRVVHSVSEKIIKEKQPVATETIAGRRYAKTIRTSRTEKAENFFVAIVDNPASTEGIYHVGKSRWEIDTTLFQDLTKNWGLKHIKTHKPVAIMAVILILLIAYALFMFYAIRHVISRCRKTKLTLVSISSILLETVNGRAPP